MRHRRIGMAVGILGMAVGATAMFVGTSLATLPVGLGLNVLGRATLEALSLRSTDSKFKVISSDDADVVIGQLTIEQGGHTGWHTHPGPTFLTVAEGKLEVTVLNADGSCTKDVLSPGEGIAEGGGVVHIASNVGRVPVVAYVTFHAIPPDVALPAAVIDWSPPAPKGPRC
jgi:quercetin dioxygenase-like cupin family protein